MIVCSKGKFKNDLLLCAGLLMGALCIWLVIFFVNRGRDSEELEVVVTVDGVEHYRGMLAAGVNRAKEGLLKKYTPAGEENRIEIDIDGHNKVVISDGRVWMEEADCPDKLCMAQGKISQPGQTIICLPNRVMVTIRGGSAQYDGVAQ